MLQALVRDSETIDVAIDGLIDRLAGRVAVPTREDGRLFTKSLLAAFLCGRKLKVLTDAPPSTASLRRANRLSQERG